MAKYCKKFHTLIKNSPSPKANFCNEQIEELRSAFDMFDPANKGYVLKPDLRKMLRTIGKNYTLFYISYTFISNTSLKMAYSETQISENIENLTPRPLPNDCTLPK